RCSRAWSSDVCSSDLRSRGLHRSARSDGCHRLLGGTDSMLRSDPEFAEQGLVISGCPEVLDRDGAAGVTDVAPPAQVDTRLNGDPGLDCCGKHRFAVLGALLFEPFQARGRDDASRDPVGLRQLASLDRDLPRGACRNEYHVWGAARGLSEHVRTLGDVLRGCQDIAFCCIVATLEHGDVLPGERDTSRAVTT